MYEQRRPDVAVFIDFENVYVSVRDKLNANPNFEAIMDRCGDLGRVVISRAYADWYRYPRVTSALYANAIEPIYVATYYYDKDVGRTGRAIKNSVDMNLCIDAMKTLFTNPNINRFVLVTGDRDFIPLVNSIRQQGKEVYIIGIGGAASTHLAQSADEFVFYEQLVGKQTGGSAAATAIANRSTELNRGLEPATEAPPREREAPPQRELPAEPQPPAPIVPQPQPAPAGEADIYAILVEAIHLVRKRGYVSTLGSIKLVMKELMGGDFKESRYRDLNGRPFAKFKDFVIDAEKRGKVQIFTNGTVNEVFLPGEDPYKLSQFAAALSEEAPVEPVVDTAVLTNGRKENLHVEIVAAEQNITPAGRRRRRRSRRGQGVAPLPADNGELLSDEPELDEPDYTVPVDEVEPLLVEDQPDLFDEIEVPVELSDFFDDQFPDELGAPGLPADLLAEDAALEETAAALGLVDLARGRGEPELAPDDLAWDAAVSALAAEDMLPPDAAWDAAAAGVMPPADAAWDTAADALHAEQAPVAAEELALVVETGPVTPEELEVSVHEEQMPVVESGPVSPEEIEAVSAAEEEAAVVVESGPVSPEEIEADNPAEEEAAVVEPIDFSAEEWAVFKQMMGVFTKPASFQQIFDTLRGQRKEHNLTRTNEQLRTMVKQAINSGLLERSGRGKRVYYTLHVE